VVGTWTALPGVLFLVLSALGLLAGAVAIIRSSYVKASLEALRGDRDDLQARLTEARAEAAECKATVAELTARVEIEVKKREAFEQVITGKRELEAVLQILREHDDRAQRVESMVLDVKRIVNRKLTG
jgi:hypothetical protein